ncbi:site-specific integrase [Hymenobacter sediminicola]|uniref:Tyrosine-type recombinase/integrase n=1 Tax=Hymenobacter sediminicola TaxID=2761579 RepID=A0A7G7W781_9BACT|nr:site-specific integrase [Hymenobacter sediminicola]QNH62224.1 tyrosine-type recombinase/integrase [Hymenobacter sediminicola]
MFLSYLVGTATPGRMASIRAYLKEPKASTATPIFFMVSASGTRSKVYTSISVPPSHWLGQEQRLRTVFAASEVKDRAERSRLAEDNESLNQRLEMMRENLRVYHRDRMAAGHLPTADELRAVVEPKQTEAPATEPNQPMPLVDFAAFIQRMALSKQPATVKSFKTTFAHLTKFWEAIPEGQQGQSLTYDDLTAEFGDRLTAYLLDEARLTDNSLSKQVSLLKQFLSDAVGRGRTTNQAYTRWKWAKRDTPIIALTADELRQLENFSLPEGHYLDNVRSLFLLSCYCGLRFSDVAALRREHDKGDFLRLTTQKTRDTLTIPVSPKARAILEGIWTGQVRPITNQVFNRAIKELCQRAGIDTLTEWLMWRAGKREKTNHPKFELISSHSGRKTFCSIAIARGIPIPAIMKATGHKSYKSLSRYLDVQENHQRAEFSKMWADEAE